MVFIVFARWLYKRWFLFLDDLTVATFRPEAVNPGPSNAEDVVGAVSHSGIPPRNIRSFSTMGLRATSLASSVAGVEGATLSSSVAPSFALCGSDGLADVGSASPPAMRAKRALFPGAGSYPRSQALGYRCS